MKQFHKKELKRFALRARSSETIKGHEKVVISYLNRQKYLLISSIGSIIVFFYLYVYNPKLSPDSMYYINGAKSIAKFKPIHAFTSLVQYQYPPGYSLVLSVPISLGFDSRLSVIFITTASVFVFTFYNLKIIELISPDDEGWTNRAIFSILFFSSSIFISIFNYAWSEVPFLAILSAVTYFMLRAFNSNVEMRRTDYLIIGVLIGMAVMVRTAGAFILVATVALFIGHDIYHKSTEWTKYILIIFPATISQSIWMLITRFYTGFFFWERTPSLASADEVLKVARTTMYNWFLNNQLPYTTKSAIIKVLVVFVFIVIIAGLKKKVVSSNFVVFAIYFIVIFGLTVYTRITTAMDGLYDRLMSPAYYFAILALLSLFQIQTFVDNSRIRTQLPIAAICLAIITANAMEFPAKFKAQPNQQAFYEHVCPNVPAGAYSNDFVGLAYYCETPIERFPRTRIYASPQKPDDLTALLKDNEGKCLSIIWVGDTSASKNTGYLPLNEVLQRLEKVTTEKQDKITKISGCVPTNPRLS